MTEPLRPPAAGLWRRARAGLAAGLEWPLSRRGLCLLFFLLAGAWALVTWVRPPLSPDLCAFQIPCRLTPDAPGLPERAVRAGAPFLPLSLGTVLAALAAAGAAASLWRPGLLGPAAGLLLAVALAANAVAVCNFPALVEALDHEQGQRQNIISALPAPGEPPPLADKRTGRIGGGPTPSGRVSAAPVQDQEWGGLSRGLAYLLYGPYLVYLAGVGVLFGTAGSLGRRLAHLAAWAVAGALLAGLACWPRLAAERHWEQAKAREAAGDCPGARAELEKAVAGFPELRLLQRTWLMAGKLDYRERRHTPAERFYLAYQYGLSKDWSRALALVRELRPTSAAEDNPAVRRLVERTEVGAGLRQLQRGDLASAEDRWAQAALLVPEARDARLLLAVVYRRLEPRRSEPVERALAPLLDSSLADQPLQADVLALVGNACMEAEHVFMARWYFAKSLDLFNMPRSQNLRAQKGLGEY
jgi:hypothetical protein